MLVENKKEILTIINRHILMPLFLSGFIVFTIIWLFNIKINFLNNYSVANIALFFGFLVFFNWFKKLEENNKLRKIIIEFSFPLFLINFLSLIILNLNLNPDLIMRTKQILITIVVFLGFIIFYSKNNKAQERIFNDQNNDLINEQKRYLEFPDSFLKLNKIPVLGSICRWVYKEGIFTIFTLIFIILINIILTVSQWPDLKGLWIDEWISIRTADVYFSDHFPYLPSGNPISYGYVYFFLLKIIQFVIPGLNSGRVLNIIFFITFSFIFYNFSKKLLKNKKIALISLLFLATSPFLIYINNEIRGYLFSLLLSYTILYFLLLGTNTYLKILTISLLSIIFVDNHITNILILVALFIIFFLEIIKNTNYRKYLVPYFFVGIILSVLAIFAYKGSILDAIYFYYSKLLGKYRPDWVSAKESLWYPILYLYKNTGNYLITLLGGIASLVLTFKNKLNAYLLIFLLLFLIPISIQRIPNSFRYFFVILPIFSIIIASGIFYIISLFKNRYFKIILYLILFIVTIGTAFASNMANVPWAKTLDFEELSNIVKPSLKSDTIIITNYMGIQISDYLPKIDYIIFDNQKYVFNENLARFGKKNILGSEFKGEPGKHFLLNIPYITIEELRSLVQGSSNQNIVIIIRPWKADIDEKTYKKIIELGFKDISSKTKPFNFFSLEKIQD